MLKTDYLGIQRSISNSFSDFMRTNNAQGELKVQASIAGGDIPLTGVRIILYKDLADGRHIFFNGMTDVNGITDGITLPAPPYKAPTLQNASGPNAEYKLSAEKNGYTGIAKTVNIYSGIRTLQPLKFTAREEY